MPSFPVSNAKSDNLLKRMKQMGVFEKDLVEEFIRGSGPGGQKINKTSVVVTLFHPLTNTRVRCQESRSQALNRFLARRLLVEKIEEKILGEKSKKQQEIEKKRRQKRKRSRRAKEKMLVNKKYQAEKKKMRMRVGEE